MTKESFFNLYTHYLIYFLCAIYFSLSIDISMPDDGLRHISFAQNIDIMKSWGDVFPYSLFSNYDPWFGWHNFLSFFLNFISVDLIHIFINIMSLFLLMVFLDQLIKIQVRYKLDSFVYIIVFIIVILTSYRYVMIRPDLLSGLFVMAALLLRNKFIYMFLLTILYGPFYYLFFLYTGSLGLVFLIQQKWKNFFAILFASIIILGFFLIHDMKGYLETIYFILNDQTLRMGLAVKEGQPIFEVLSYLDYYILLPVFLGISFFVIYKNYEYFKNNALASFLLITSILWINQYRYFHLFMPIIFVYAFSLIMNINKKHFFYILRKYQLGLKKYFSYSKNKKLFYIIAIPYSIVMLGYIYSFQSVNNKVEKGKVFQNKIYDNKIILSNKMDAEMFSALYYNPKIKTIPSCSIGWFNHENKDMKKLYIKMNGPYGLNEEELSSLIENVNADFYFHYTKTSTKNLNISKLEKLGIIAKTILKDKIVFEIRKQNE